MKYYVVYFDNITHYGITNKGYFVKYKNKLEDEYSENFIEAKRYKTLTPALTRLGYINKYGIAKEIIETFDKHINVLRQKKLNRLIGETGVNYDNIKIFKNGRIEVVEVKNNKIKIIGEPKEEIYQFFNKIIESHNNKIKPLYPNIKVDQGNLDDEFWS